MRFQFGLLLSAALGTMSIIEAARAEAPSPDEEAAKTEARDRLNRGNELLREGQHEGALAEYEAAYRAFASPKIRLNIAEAQFQLGNWRGAYESYSAFLNEAPDESDLHGAARDRRAELETKLAFLILESPVVGTTVNIDGEEIGSPPQERIPLNPGRHVVRATKSGHQPFENVALIGSGETKTVVLALVPEAPPPLVTEARAQKDEGSVLEKWWFWAIVGGAVIAGGVVVVAASTGGSDFLPSGELGSSATSSWEPL